MQVFTPPLLYSITLGSPIIAIGTAIAVILYLIGLGGVAKKQRWAPLLIALTTIGFVVLFVVVLSKDIATSFNALVSGIIMAVVLVILAVIVYWQLKTAQA